MSEIKRYNIHFVQKNPAEYFQPYATPNEQGEWVRWEDVQHLAQPTTKDSLVHVPEKTK
jgi:hypothetical protein